MIISLLIIVFFAESSLGYSYYCDTSIVKNDTFVTCTTISDGK